MTMHNYASSVFKSKVVKGRVGLPVLGSCNLDWCTVIRTPCAVMCIQAIWNYMLEPTKQCLA